MTAEADAPQDAQPRWKLNLLMFVLTVATAFAAGADGVAAGLWPIDAWYQPFALFYRIVTNPRVWLEGYRLGLPLMAILVCHEFGHYIAARLHRVPASLPFFLPLPVLSPFGTAGAVIAMSGRIRSRNALLDIGAAGPIAGLVVAIPVLWWGLAHSPVEALPPGGYQQEGQSLLYWGLKLLVKGPIPAGYDVTLHPTAFAGWGGLLITSLNLLPFGQLDGGHIAYALFGKSQDKASLWVRRALLLMFAFNVARFGLPILLGDQRMTVGVAIGNSLTWLFVYGLLGLLTRVGGVEHPPFEPGPLSPARRALAWACLVIFVLLFMPTPFATYP